MPGGDTEPGHPSFLGASGLLDGQNRNMAPEDGLCLDGALGEPRWRGGALSCARQCQPLQRFRLVLPPLQSPAHGHGRTKMASVLQIKCADVTPAELRGSGQSPAKPCRETRGPEVTLLWLLRAPPTGSRTARRAGGHTAGKGGSLEALMAGDYEDDCLHNGRLSAGGSGGPGLAPSPRDPEE